MKLKKSLSLFSLSLLMFSQTAYVKVQALTAPGVILQQQLTVPNSAQGVNVLINITESSTVTLTFTANQSAPTFNVYVLYPDNYAMYKLTGSLAHATPLKPFTALNTLSYTASGIINPGPYGLVIQQAQTSNATNVSVGVQVTAQ
jgi:hypothetical protein